MMIEAGNGKDVTMMYDTCKFFPIVAESSCIFEAKLVE